MNLSRPFVLALLAFVTSVPSALQAGTTTSPKIVISNMTGQEIPLETGSTVEVLSNGDLSVRCRLDANSNCPSIGASPEVVVGDPPTASLTPSATTLTAGTGFILNWTSSGDTCYAAGPSNVTNWSGRALPPTGNQPLSLAQGSYTFSLRCYNAAGSRTVQTAVVTVDPAPVASGYCSEYYGPIVATPISPDFNAYGFEKVEYTFQQVWGVEPGASAPKVGVPGTFLNPAMSAGGIGRYMAISFDLASVDASTMSQIRLSWVEAQGLDTTTGKITLTVSPCPGDFRPPVSGSNDAFLSESCRVTAARTSGSLAIATAGSGLSGCPVPAGKRMYINVAPYEIYGGSAPTAPTCSPGQPHCGVALRNE